MDKESALIEFGKFIEAFNDKTADFKIINKSHVNEFPNFVMIVTMKKESLLKDDFVTLKAI